MAPEQCCCFNLRTGSLIIIWVDLVFAIFGVCAGNSIIHSILLVIAMLGIYAIIKKQPEFLWPHIIYQMFCIGIVLIAAVIAFALAFVVGGIDVPRNMDRDLKVLIELVQSYALLLFLAVFSILALLCYLLKVVVLYYQQMKMEIPAYTQTVTIGNMERGNVPQYEPQVMQLMDHMSCEFKH